MKMTKTFGILLTFFLTSLMLSGMSAAASYDTVIEITLVGGDYQGEGLVSLGRIGLGSSKVDARIIDSNENSLGTWDLRDGDYRWEVGHSRNLGPVTLEEGELYGLRISYYRLETTEGGYTEGGVIPCQTTSDSFGNCDPGEAHWFVG